jgi:seryl-tRNA synthetase
VQDFGYKGKGAKLTCLNRYFLDKNTAAGYNEVQVPHIWSTKLRRPLEQDNDKERTNVPIKPMIYI